MDQGFIQEISNKLAQPLPGREAQYRMAHVVRTTYQAPPTDARIASVLALFYPKNDEWHLVFIERAASHPGDRHAGQISFPGGKKEPQDQVLSDTALREAEEEIGVRASDIQLLGGLTDLYIPVSNFQVHPFVGWLDYTPEFSPQESEVAAVIEVPLHEFLTPEIIQSRHLQISPNLRLRNVPFFNVHGKTLWGATAMMMSELLHVLEAPQFSK
jgi:8-oxo-dGTP pyrophosphatase MutT (NUDIX family)